MEYVYMNMIYFKKHNSFLFKFYNTIDNFRIYTIIQCLRYSISQYIIFTLLKKLFENTHDVSKCFLKNKIKE